VHDHPDSSDWNTSPAFVLYCSYLYWSTCVPRQRWVTGNVASGFGPLHPLVFPVCNYSWSAGGVLDLYSEEVHEETRYGISLGWVWGPD